MYIYTNVHVHVHVHNYNSNSLTCGFFHVWSFMNPVPILREWVWRVVVIAITYLSQVEGVMCGVQSNTN